MMFLASRSKKENLPGIHDVFCIEVDHFFESDCVNVDWFHRIVGTLANVYQSWKNTLPMTILSEISNKIASLANDYQ